MCFKTVVFVFSQIILILEVLAFFFLPWFHDEKDKMKGYTNTAKPGPRPVGVPRLIIWYQFKVNFKIFIQDLFKGAGRFWLPISKNVYGNKFICWLTLLPWAEPEVWKKKNSRQKFPAFLHLLFSPLFFCDYSNQTTSWQAY